MQRTNVFTSCIVVHVCLNENEINWKVKFVRHRLMSKGHCLADDDLLLFISFLCCHIFTLFVRTNTSHLCHTRTVTLFIPRAHYSCTISKSKKKKNIWMVRCAEREGNKSKKCKVQNTISWHFFTLYSLSTSSEFNRNMLSIFMNVLYFHTVCTGIRRFIYLFSSR